MTLPSRSVCLYADGAQYPLHLDRGIARQVSEHAHALHALAPSILHSVQLNPEFPLTGNLSSFLGSGLLQWAGEPSAGTRRPVPRLYHVMSPFEPPTPIDVMWPQWARDPRIATVVTLHDLIPLVLPEKYLDEPPKRATYMARLELVRRADAILAVSQQTAEDAIEQLHVPSGRVHVLMRVSASIWPACTPRNRQHGHNSGDSIGACDRDSFSMSRGHWSSARTLKACSPDLGVYRPPCVPRINS